MTKEMKSIIKLVVIAILFAIAIGFIYNLGYNNDFKNILQGYRDDVKAYREEIAALKEKATDSANKAERFIWTRFVC